MPKMIKYPIFNMCYLNSGFAAWLDYVNKIGMKHPFSIIDDFMNMYDGCFFE